ncbi:MAG: endonuclease III [bacterium]
MEVKDRVRKIVGILKAEYPDARCSLRFENPLELLVATILSAQCTDERVNSVTETLFEKYRSAADYAAAPPEVLEEDIKSTGFYRNKAKRIIECCRALVEEYGGAVPDSPEELVQLKGVGRKTANVVLGNAFGIPAIAVDTHVKRVSNRLGLTSSTDPDKIEADLMEVIPREDWTVFSHLLVYHGRTVCQARKPLCQRCRIAPLCSFYLSGRSR